MNRDELTDIGNRLLVLAGTIAEDVHNELISGGPDLPRRALRAAADGHAIGSLTACAAVLGGMTEKMPGDAELPP
jgi:hypothetical protein